MIIQIATNTLISGDSLRPLGDFSRTHDPMIIEQYSALPNKHTPQNNSNKISTL